MDNIRNSIEVCETYVSLKKEVKYLCETLSKFTNGKENLELVLSSQRPSVNKSGLGFKSNKMPSKGLNRKKNQSIYKCTHYKKFGYLEPLCFDKLKRSKGNNLNLMEKQTHLDLRKFRYQR